MSEDVVANPDYLKLKIAKIRKTDRVRTAVTVEAEILQDIPHSIKVSFFSSL